MKTCTGIVTPEPETSSRWFSGSSSAGCESSPAHLGHSSAHSGNIVELGQISMTGESLAFASIYQDFDLADPRHIRGNCLDQRQHGQLLRQYTGPMRIGERAVHINYCDIAVDDVHVINIRTGR